MDGPLAQSVDSARRRPNLQQDQRASRASLRMFEDTHSTDTAAKVQQQTYNPALKQDHEYNDIKMLVPTHGTRTTFSSCFITGLARNRPSRRARSHFNGGQGFRSITGLPTTSQIGSKWSKFTTVFVRLDRPEFVRLDSFDGFFCNLTHSLVALSAPEPGRDAPPQRERPRWRKQKPHSLSDFLDSASSSPTL